jgi:GNAT superfamily N-acetyltransferase
MAEIGGSAAAARWRAMVPADLAAVTALADAIHPAYPESPAVFGEKLRLFPRGCFILELPDGRIVGYGLSHPWTKGAPPALDTLLGRLPAPPTTYFLHDIAIAAPLRAHGLGARLVSAMTIVGKAVGLTHLTLVAVHGSERRWRKAGFRATPDPALQAHARAGYGEDAIHMEMDLHGR